VWWYREGHLSSNGRCFDIGNTVRAAVSAFERSGDPFSGSTDHRSAGNGSLMRLAPLPLAYVRHSESAIRLAGESSCTTPGAAEAVDACRHFAGLIIGALNGADKEALLAPAFCPEPGLWQGEPPAPGIAEVAAGSFRRREPAAVRDTGYVVQSLEAALRAFDHGADFREGSLLAVNLADVLTPPERSTGRSPALTTVSRASRRNGVIGSLNGRRCGDTQMCC
jgi:ADP-ribosyl-[dinitrogen reductase] hydrolase